MTSEPPPSPTRPTRPGVAARRQALGLEGIEPPAAAAPPVAVRESLRESLARIPDLEEAGPPVLVGAGLRGAAARPGDAQPQLGITLPQNKRAPMIPTGKPFAIVRPRDGGNDVGVLA